MQELVNVDASEQIKKFQEFLESYYYSQIVENLRKDNKFVVVDFADLSKFDLDLANGLLESPDDTIKAAEIAIAQFDLENIAGFKVRFKNLPESQNIMIRNIRSKHIGRLIYAEGIVRQKSDVRPQVTAAKFECPVCGNIINVLQLNGSFKEPTKCGCGRKGKFVMLSKELVDAQGIVLEEVPESLEGGEQPKRINIFLKDDLVSPLSEKKTNPGSKVSIIGIIKEVPIILKTGSKSTTFDIIVEANHIETVEETFYEVKISEEDEQKIIELSQDPELYSKLVNSLAPSIYGYGKVKEALLLQLVGGVRKVRSDKVVSRGDTHILLVGDPGSGKSAMLKRISVIAPKGRYVSGRGISGAGLTAAVVKDEFLKGWSLEAGALVLASNGICCIDEMDKMISEDRAAMHEALEQQTVSISKANIQATLISRTTVLAAANPKFGRFDPFGIIAEQINMPPTLINRFDLIFPIKDLPDEARDEKMASHILKLHQDPDFYEPEISTEFLRKYIAYAKQKVVPTITNNALQEIKEFYLKMRTSGSEEGGIKAIPISARQLEALVRLTEATARLRLSDKATESDAKRAIGLIEYCLMEVGLDKETGKIDIDRIATGISASQRSHIIVIKDIITDLENKVGKAIPIDDVIAEAKSKGVDEGKVEEVLEKLKRVGEIFEPRRGFLSKI
ncbi:MAG: minichromosome maintenance protein MCM [Candidatus Woesearchaeota archaeon]|jgi:replicative DNA helicase Mcm|nr:minichromosome maintenance protein MCM [Candidatus Woesearchaeota archaeon]MDP7322411.1 minichromosome maintenance protein MCM [Candidatus Woesearchaeota archaeon]MDP7476517.1 minichromosome maintenance protein MCM [Candidatus Woesearchaeota archaeon]HJO01617.1 minichromosome maintenance protein MCM [Candidatus Woesearchaeota archaeon]|tara:strand:- start:762 stop:2795 length:2034 start_codon:yes stop_codon:yes gene_type:complete